MKYFNKIIKIDNEELIKKLDKCNEEDLLNIETILLNILSINIYNKVEHEQEHEQGYKCDNCMKWFSTKDSLKNHSNKKVKCKYNEEIGCKYCKKILCNKTYKKKHEKKCILKSDFNIL